MTDFRDTDACVTAYTGVFDFYMESGRMPADTDPADPLAEYIRSAVDDNRRSAESDPEMPGIIREATVSAVSEIVESLGGMQSESRAESDLIDSFEAASIEEKRQLWGQVKSTIEQRYSVLEVNLPGYIERFATDDRDAVFAALIDDWRHAFEERMMQRMRQLVASRQQELPIMIKADYEEQRRVRQMMFRYPQLGDIVDTIGRDKESPTDETDSVIYRYIPAAVARNRGFSEIDRVEAGCDLERVLPVEMSMPDDLFIKRFVTRGLQQFGSPGADRPRRTAEHRPAPRLGKGPVIVAVDTSGSMSGTPLQIAFSLIRQIASMTRRQGRPCFLIQFSMRTEAIDLSLPRNRSRLSAFLEKGFTGGTSGEQMLSKALDTLATDSYEMADVLIVSDLQFPAPSRFLADRITREQALGTRFYALQIGRQSHLYTPVLDRIWQI